MPLCLVTSVAAFAQTFCRLLSIMSDQPGDKYELDTSDSVGSDTEQNLFLGVIVTMFWVSFYGISDTDLCFPLY